MTPTGTFLVVGENPPQVHMLTRDEVVTFYERCRIAETAVRKQDALEHAYKTTFKVVAKYALPAWSKDCMVEVATRYEGPHQDAVRGIAAALALGKPYTKDADNKGKKGPVDDGDRVPRRPVQPQGGSPAKVSPLAQLMSVV